MKRNEYVRLASRSFVSVCDLAALLQISASEASKVDLVAEVVEETRRLWERLVWSDRSLNHDECAVFDAIAQLAEENGYRLSATPQQDQGEPTTRELPEFLRIASLSEMHGPRLAGRIINHLETFGYGVLAADRQISDAELASLQGYVEGLRREVEAVRAATGSTDGLALAA